MAIRGNRKAWRERLNRSLTREKGWVLLSARNLEIPLPHGRVVYMSVYYRVERMACQL